MMSCRVCSPLRTRVAPSKANSAIVPSLTPLYQRLDETERSLVASKTAGENMGLHSGRASELCFGAHMPALHCPIRASDWQGKECGPGMRRTPQGAQGTRIHPSPTAGVFGF